MVNNAIMNFIKTKAVYTKLPNILPVMHSCECFDCESIIQSEELSARPCTVFHEDLLYFFYGKPSYPIGNKETGNRTDDYYCPVCFIVDINKIDIYKVFPFDSGAFSNHLYSEFIHRHMKIENFELNNSMEDIKAYISVVFENNDNYLSGNSVCLEDEDTYVNALVRMLSAKGTFKFDERANTVEIITHNSVNIKDAIIGIVIPETFLRKKPIRDYLALNKIEYKTYHVRGFTAPSRYNEIVYQLAMEFI